VSTCSPRLAGSSIFRRRRRRAAVSAYGLDWRKNEPTILAVGPVLHPVGAVASKVCPLFGRAEARDYVDVHAILASGRYTEDELLGVAADHDPGFDRAAASWTTSKSTTQKWSYP
jgi:hypothetical protein